MRSPAPDDETLMSPRKTHSVTAFNSGVMGQGKQGFPLDTAGAGIGSSHCRSDGLQPCEKKPAERGVRDGIPLSDCHGYSLIGYSFFLFETRSSALSISNVSSNVFPKETAVWRSASSSDMPRFRAVSLSPLGHCIFSGHRLINSLLSCSSEPILL